MPGHVSISAKIRQLRALAAKAQKMRALAQKAERAAQAAESRLERALGNASVGGTRTSKGAKRKYNISDKARRRIAAAQKKRWKAYRIRKRKKVRS